MSDAGTVVKTLVAGSNDVPIVGAVSFFLGTEQPYRVVVDEATCVATHLLALCLVFNS